MFKIKIDTTICTVQITNTYCGPTQLKNLSIKTSLGQTMYVLALSFSHANCSVQCTSPTPQNAIDISIKLQLTMDNHDITDISKYI